jgi:hypothetical protein
LLYELTEYLSRRFPDVYHVRRAAKGKDHSGWYGEPAIQEITVVPLGKTYKLTEGSPLTTASLLSVPSLAQHLQSWSCADVRLVRIQEDLAIMIEGTDGRYYLQGGAVLIPGSSKCIVHQQHAHSMHNSPGMWRLRDKIGMSLDDIHISGTVPQCTPTLPLSRLELTC